MLGMSPISGEMFLGTALGSDLRRRRHCEFRC
jgi:hypothetical protein